MLRTTTMLAADSLPCEDRDMAEKLKPPPPHSSLFQGESMRLLLSMLAFVAVFSVCPVAWSQSDDPLGGKRRAQTPARPLQQRPAWLSAVVF